MQDDNAYEAEYGILFESVVKAQEFLCVSIINVFIQDTLAKLLNMYFCKTMFVIIFVNIN